MGIKSSHYAGLALCLVAGLTQAFADPKITSIVPSKVYVCNSTSVSGADVRDFQIFGTGLVAKNTTGYTINSDVVVLVGHSGDLFVPAPLTGWTGGELDVELSCPGTRASLYTPGKLGFKVVLRGDAGNVFEVPLVAIPRDPPTIVSIYPAVLKTGMRGTFDYLVGIQGKNTPEDTTATIGGVTTVIGNADFIHGSINVWVPAAFRSKPAKYRVLLHDSRGKSNAVYLAFRAP